MCDSEEFSLDDLPETTVGNQPLDADDLDKDGEGDEIIVSRVRIAFADLRPSLTIHNVHDVRYEDQYVLILSVSTEGLPVERAFNWNAIRDMHRQPAQEDQ